MTAPAQAFHRQSRWNLRLLRPGGAAARSGRWSRRVVHRRRRLRHGRCVRGGCGAPSRRGYHRAATIHRHGERHRPDQSDATRPPPTRDHQQWPRQLAEILRLQQAVTGGTVARLGVRRPVGYLRVCSLAEGGCVAWMLRLVKIGVEGDVARQH